MPLLPFPLPPSRVVLPRWSMKVEGGAKMGAPELHDCMAECHWKYAQHKVHHHTRIMQHFRFPQVDACMQNWEESNSETL